ncbi:MAG: nickel-dependent lactate racemase [Candidatus Krumholzibacteriota bacterium]|nr:nickel-dependent lactate racemase [Candidatus Krumholzibacteriota bacterium]
MNYPLLYDSATFDLTAADGIDVAGSDYPDALSDPESEFIKALENPSGSSPLFEILPAKGRVSILISDMTRGASSNRILSYLLRYLDEKGAGPDRVEIFLAMGMHRVHSREEIEDLFGRETLNRYKIHEHDARDRDSLVDVGTTPAGTRCFFNAAVVDSSLIIGIGNVSFHYFAGFGGSRKLILPGIAGEETIISNHRLSLMEDPGEGLVTDCRPGEIEKNPVHRDMVAGARLLRSPVFILNTIFDHKGGLVFINGGDMVESHRYAASWYMDRFSIRIERPYRAVIASAGGRPYDINLLQSHKAIRYASLAVDDGGLLLMAAACPDGIGSDSYSGAFSMGRERVPELVSGEYTLNSQTAMSTHDLTGRISVYLRSMIDDKEISRFGFCPWKTDYDRYLLEGIDPSDILLIKNAASFLPVISYQQ